MRKIRLRLATTLRTVLSLAFDPTEKELLGSSKAQHQLDPDSKRHVTCGSGEITFSELTPLKSPIRIPGCYGNGRLHQNNNMVRTTSPRRLRKLERKRQRAPENPRTHNGPPDRSLTPLQVKIRSLT